MSGKRRRYESSWDMKQDKIPPPESNDSRRPSWEGNRKVPRYDDISRDNKHRTFDGEWGKQHTTYRDRSRSPIQSRSRSRGREWESRRSPFYDDRHKSNDYGDDVRYNSRGDNMKESWRHRSDHLSGGGSRYSRFPHHKDDRNHHHHDDDDGDDDRCRSNRVTKIQCKFFAVGKCYRDNCKFSHDASALDSQDYDRRSHDNIRAHKNSTWHHHHHHHDHDQQPHASDLSEKKKSWGGPTWDDVESGGFDENKKTTWEWDSHDKKKSWDDDDDDATASKDKVKEIIDHDVRLNSQDKRELQEELGISDVNQEESTRTWQERLQIWKEILRKEQLAEQLDSSRAKYAVEFDMKEVEKSFREEDAKAKATAEGTRALWISKRWWRYRPKLPYTYFLEKLQTSEVAAVVFTEDLKRLYVTMNEGFPLEYVVDMPLDPYLFEMITNSGAEVDLLQKRQSHYLLKLVIALLPTILVLCFLRESIMLLHITSKRFLYKKYNQLYDMAYAENFILPVREVDETKSMYKDVVLGGDVWDLLDELMIYMRNPMRYYEKQVKFVRGVLLSGPPGTGKTLFARTLAKESGMPFVFASGAEFTDSEKSGAARINQMFSIARRNAPAFIFVDEIDAIAGRHARKDPRRRSTFEALIAQLDGDKEKTGVDRFSLRQAVIFICATNRPDELDLEFVSGGRIDRRLYIGLPDANQRLQIFGVHSSGKQLAHDVEFNKLVFRTVGYSGADIRNLVNEAGIMAVRKGHTKIYQQDIVDVLDKQLLEGMGVLLTEEEQQKCEERVSAEKKRLLAVHEAGHIVLAHLFPRFDWHAFSQLLPGGKETAISVFYPREDMVDQGYTSFGYMMMQMVVAHGGRCAERLVFGDDVTDGGTDDLEKITKIAREMVISPRNARLGFATLTNRVGLANRADTTDGELIKYRWDDPHVVPADMTVEVSELFTRELTRYIQETEEVAIKGLTQNRHILDLISRELLEKSRITGVEVKEIVGRMSPQMFEDFVKPFQINAEEEGPLPHNEQLRYQALDVYPAPLHRC